MDSDTMVRCVCRRVAAPLAGVGLIGMADAIVFPDFTGGMRKERRVT